MPRTEVLLFCERDGTCPLAAWLDGLAPPAQAKCVARLKRLEDMGHELRRPEADLLRDGSYELRTSHGKLNLRVLYFFHGRNVVVVAHGLAKQSAGVPAREIQLARARKAAFETDPKAHTFKSAR